MGLTVVAFGGNALTRRGERGTHEEQVENAGRACGTLARLLAGGERLVVVHGNGPQVGRELDRSHAARDHAPPLSLDVCVAATQGMMGYALELALREAMRAQGLGGAVATLATLVRVDPSDPAFARPDKPVGPFLERGEAEELARARGLPFVEDAGRGHRRVVPSPRPIEVLDLEAVRALTGAGHVVIAAGGGGIPVVRSPAGRLLGVEAVVDKDHTASLLARGLGATRLVDLTAVDAVYRDFGTSSAAPITQLSLAEARSLLAAGAFPPGSMGPKIEALVSFVEGTGGLAIVSSLERLDDALEARAGTRIYP